MTAARVVRIGGASGAWGDSPMAIGQLLGADVKVDYLMMDYLAEVTMSLLARARLKDPAAGYPPDFVGYLKPHLADIAARGVKVVSNAGGVNPRGCKQALDALVAELGLNLKVAVVEGDDLMPMADALRRDGVREWVTGEPLPQRLLTANAYLGALPIAAALAHGADIVVTGRCVDSALALGALMHEFGWTRDQHDMLAAGSLVGHLLECGPQVTGGVFTDWERVPDWHRIGYPIAECVADGSFVLTKPAGTGGLVEPASVAEQVLYEIGDPAAYFLPDVTADFSNVQLLQDGPSRVRVSGARGLPPTAQYKVSATHQDGQRAVAMACIVGVDAVRKAERTGEALVARARMHFSERGFADFRHVLVEVLGGESVYGRESRARAAREVVLRLVVEHDDRKALDLFARELGSVGLSCAQGTTGLIGGRPKPTPIVRLYTFFIDKAALASVTVQVADAAPFAVELPLDGGYVAVQPSTSTPAVAGTATAAATRMASGASPQPAAGAETSTAPEAASPASAPSTADDTIDVPLLAVAHARSGDKGNSSNIAIFCRRPEHMAHLRTELTVERIAAHFAECADGPVRRYEAPGLAAFNFLIDNALGGGGMASARIDPQGKAYGQRALEMMVRVPRAWLAAGQG